MILITRWRLSNFLNYFFSSFHGNDGKKFINKKIKPSFWNHFFYCCCCCCCIHESSTTFHFVNDLISEHLLQEGKMPLFSSKFSFKKSQTRRLSRKTELNNYDDEEDDDDSNESITSNDDGGGANNEITRIKRPNRKQSPSKIIVDEKQQQAKIIVESSGGENMIIKNNKRRKKRPKSKPNRAQSNADDGDGRKMTLIIDSNHRFSFDHHNGTWNHQNLKPPMKTIDDNNQQQPLQRSTDEKINQLQTVVEQLREENRLLKLKIEILIEMVTETTAELNLNNNSKNAVTKK